jgi:DNA-binding CsgD family transcriptional regulator
MTSKREEKWAVLEARLDKVLEQFREDFEGLVARFEGNLKADRLLSALTLDLRWTVAEVRLATATYVLNRFQAGHPLALTARQKEIARLLARRLPRREMAEALGISPRTLDTHIERICRKYSAASKEDLVRRLGPGFAQPGGPLA